MVLAGRNLQALGAPKQKKAVMYLTENMCVHKLCSGLSYSAVCCEFDVNKSAGILNKVSLNINT